MRLLPRSLKWRTILLTLLGLIAIGGSVWYTFRADISQFVKQQRQLDRMRKSKSPVDQMIGRGELREGASVAELADAYPPADRIRHDEYETLKYDMKWVRVNLWVIAVDGRVVYAGSDPGSEPGYVGQMSPNDYWRYQASLLRWERNLIAGMAAVNGVAAAGTLDPQHFPPTDDDAP